MTTTTPSTPACAEQAHATSGEILTPEEAQRTIAEMQQAVQSVPSYVDQQIATSRGLLESIASLH